MMEEKQAAPIDKIKKLLALSQSNNENEAAVALAQAMKLAAAHGLEIKDIEASGSEQIEREDIGKFKSSIPQWEKILAANLAHVFGCRLIHSYSRVWLTGRRVSKMVAVGFATDVKIFTYVHAYLLQTLKRLTKEKLARHMHGRSAKIQRSFLLGGTWAVLENAEKVFRREATPEENQLYALVLKRGGLVDKHLAGMQTARTKKVGDVDGLAFAAGYEFGKRIPLNKGIEAAEAEKQALKSTALLS